MAIGKPSEFVTLNKQQAVSGHIKPVVSCDWVDAQATKPSVNDEFNESDHVLCIAYGIYPFTGLYTKN